jgi:hypothetical protein
MNDGKTASQGLPTRARKTTVERTERGIVGEGVDFEMTIPQVKVLSEVLQRSTLVGAYTEAYANSN